MKSRDPLWDDPDLAKDTQEGRYFLPNSATGLRETIITSPINAEPQYLQIIPGPSPFPTAAAFFTAAFFLSLTVQAYAFAMFCGVIAVGCMLRWMWDSDPPLEQKTADIGAGITVPVAITGTSSHGWWGLNVLMMVMGMIGAMMLFSYLYLFGLRPDIWIAAPPLEQTLGILGLFGATTALAWLSRRMLSWRKPGIPAGQLPWITAALAATCLALGVWWDWSGWSEAGLDPVASGRRVRRGR